MELLGFILIFFIILFSIIALYRLWSVHPMDERKNKYACGDNCRDYDTACASCLKAFEDARNKYLNNSLNTDI